MKQLKQQFVDSWHELRKTKVMAVAAMLIAIGVILGFFSVQLTEFIRIGFSGIPNELASMLFGPVVGGIMGGIGDILKFLIKPTGPYFFGYTLNAMLGPVIYGIFLSSSDSIGKSRGSQNYGCFTCKSSARYLVADDPVWKRISGNPSGEIYKTGSFRSD